MIHLPVVKIYVMMLFTVGTGRRFTLIPADFYNSDREIRLSVKYC